MSGTRLTGDRSLDAPRRDLARRPADRPRRAAPTSTASGSSSTTRPAFRADGIRDLAWTAAFSEDEATTAAAQWLVWEASQELGRPLGQHPGAVRGAGPRRGRRASRSRRSTSGRRRSTWPGRSTRRPRRRGVGAVILELARSEQTYTFQRPIDYATSVLAGADRGRLAGPGLHPGRPLPVQRQEVRRRSRRR